MHPNKWSHWKWKFKQFRLVSGFALERQVTTLLYCMGEAVEDILLSTGILSEDKKKINSILAKFDTFFQVRRNVIFECTHFNRHSQGQNESIEQFITSLY